MMNDTYLYPYSSAEAREAGRASSLAGEPQGEHRLPQRHRGRHPSELRRDASGQELHHAGAGGIRLQAHRVGACQHPARAQVGWAFRPCQQAVGGARLHSQRHQPQQRLFVVRSHPAVLDGFVTFYRKAEQALDLFGAEHCVGDRASRTSPARCWCCHRRRCGSSIGGRKTSSGMLGAVLAASRIPVVEQSLPPASRTAKQPDGTGRISPVCWMTSSCPTGRGKSWRR